MYVTLCPTEERSVTFWTVTWEVGVRENIGDKEGADVIFEWSQTLCLILLWILQSLFEFS